MKQRREIMSEITEKTQPLEEAPKDDSSQAAELTIDFLTDEEERKVKRIDSDTLTLNGDTYKIVEDYREALDLDMLEERYSEFLEKYDYIVGDISYEKLRLRGFYEDRNKKVPIDMRISNLEDYLLEYCSFGCKYFVLERLEPKKKYRNKSKRRRENKRNKNEYQNKKQKNLEKFEKVKKRKDQSKKQTTSSKKQETQKKTFVKKERNKDTSKKNETNTLQEEKKVKTIKDNKGNTKFQIRRKK